MNRLMAFMVIAVGFVLHPGASMAANHALTVEGLVLEPVIQDLGQVQEGDHVLASLLVRNNTAEIASIIDVQASCGCTQAVPDQTVLAPGEFTVMNINIDTAGKTGAVKKSVIVTDQAGRQSTAWMTLNVVAADPHRALPQHGIFDAACARCHVTPARGKASGKAVFAAVCAMCHGKDAKGAYAPDLTQIDDANVLFAMIADGVNPSHMPGFLKKNGGPLTEIQIHLLVKWLLSLD